ncbi:hemin-degrading factor [Janthinobacterium agaricidamnosum]|uniref:Haemin-degrading family protein n=1 Tax=Janthinobacterium agaricidamnosum NBRC 102515 = DSM 9628 TaxID=1349767 RepID=W0V6Q6_9BURK|nr:hemin-degrading factor [Janthinobacterium agaricidamnosum]CDG84504.1 haemin-degrading family protein [Janthinobacterium agaricidamnosum NBRC 102515 = DSM 9628]
MQSTQINTIQASFATLRREKKARHRDIAEQLDISEGELIAAHIGATGAMTAQRLLPDWPTIIEALEPLGEVMALTRNASCVHEKIGVYRKASNSGHIGLVLGGAIDLRVFYRLWAFGFAVSEQGEKEPQRSLQFFDASGTAVHKIFLKPHSDLAAYETLVSRFADDNQTAGIAVGVVPASAPELPDEQIDVAGFRAAWADLRDTHEFFMLLKKFSVSRLQGLRLAEARFVQQVDQSCVLDLLNDAVREGVSIMAFVGNPGMIQIHSGPVHKVAVMGPWINVLDPGFNLHLREDHIASAWVVRKPTVDGLVTSLELFDDKGDTIVMFFGERKPGAHELCEWRAVVDNVVREHELCAA